MFTAKGVKTSWVFKTVVRLVVDHTFHSFVLFVHSFVHSFINSFISRSCLETLARRSNWRYINCPLCRQAAPLQARNTNQFPINTFVEELQKTKRELDETKSLLKQCLEQVDNGPRKCSRHKEAKVIFCKTCSITICAMCIITEHIKHQLITLEDEKKYKEFFVEGLKQQAMAIAYHWETHRDGLEDFKEHVVTCGREQVASVDARVEELVKSIQDNGKKLKEEIQSNTREQEQKLEKEIKMVEDCIEEIMSVHTTYDSKVLDGLHHEDIANIDLSRMKEMMRSLDSEDRYKSLAEYTTPMFDPDTFNFTSENLGKIEIKTSQIPEPSLPKVVAKIDTPYVTERRIISTELDTASRDKLSLCGGFIAITGYKHIEDDNTHPYYVRIYDKETLLPLWDHQIGAGVGYGAIDTGICMGKIDGEVYLFVSYTKMQQIEVWRVGEKSLVSSYVFHNHDEDVDLFHMECKNNRFYFTEGYFDSNPIFHAGGLYTTHEPKDPLVTFQSMSIGSNLTLELNKRIRTKFTNRKYIQGFCVANMERDKDVFIVTNWRPDQVAAFDEDGNFIWMLEFDSPSDLCWDGTYLYVHCSKDTDEVEVVNYRGERLLTMQIPLDISLYQALEDDWGRVRGLAVYDNAFGVFLSKFHGGITGNIESNELYVYSLNYTKIKESESDSAQQ